MGVIIFCCNRWLTSHWRFWKQCWCGRSWCSIRVTMIMMTTIACSRYESGKSRKSERRAFTVLSSVCWRWWRTMSGWPESPAGQWLQHQLRKLIECECSGKEPNFLYNILYWQNWSGLCVKTNLSFSVLSTHIAPVIRQTEECQHCYIKVKVKVNVDLRRLGMARVLKESHSFTCTPRVHPLTEWTIPAFAFSAEAGTNLPTPEGWKAELAFGGWLVTYRNKCPTPGIELGHGRPSQY